MLYQFGKFAIIKMMSRASRLCASSRKTTLQMLFMLSFLSNIPLTII